MTRLETRTVKVADVYVAKLKERFPLVDAEPVFEPFYGYDFTVDVLVPCGRDDLLDEVTAATLELNLQAWEEQGLTAVALVTEEEPVRG